MKKLNRMFKKRLRQQKLTSIQNKKELIDQIVVVFYRIDTLNHEEQQNKINNNNNCSSK